MPTSSSLEAVVRLFRCLQVATDFKSLEVEVGTKVQASISAAAEETMEQVAISFPVLRDFENYLHLSGFSFLFSCLS